MRRSALAWTLFAAACGQRPVDVVFITIDTLRYDHISALNPDSPAQTPNMDRLVRGGVAYTQAYSPISVTGPAFTTLLTGQRPGTHGVVMNVFRGGNALDPKTPTIAKELKRAGYHTGAFVSGFTLRRDLGLARGFHRYDPPREPRRPGGQTAGQMWTWLQMQPGPIFTWYHSYDPHGPLEPYADPPITPSVKRGGPNLDRIPEYQRIGNISDAEFFAARYATAVEYADAQVGRVFNVLNNTGRFDDALIILTADHGESFDERELWFDHGTTAHEEQLHVPLLIRYPRDEGGGQQVDALVGLEDVMPTVLDYLGMELPGGMDGHSLRGDEVGHEVLYGESSHCKGEAVLTCAPKGPGGKELAVRTAGRTTVRRVSKEGVAYARYDRHTDRPELRPLAPPSRPDSDTAEPPVTWDEQDAQMVEALEEMADVRQNMDLKGPSDKPKGEETAAERREREQLQALGYVDQ